MKTNPEGRVMRNAVALSTKIPWLLVIALALLLLPGRAAAQSATVTDDATIQLSSPTTNNGTSSNLGVQGPNLQESYIRFDLSVLPSGLQASNISKATLRLFLANVSMGGTFDVRLVTGIWSEKTLTYNNAPPAGLLIAGSVPTNTSQARDFVLVDATSAVQAWLLSGTANNGIVLIASPGSSISVNFDSKEASSTSHDPRIEIEVVSAGPQGTQGTAGPQGATGPAGTAGAAATVQVRSTTTVSASMPASVLNGGTQNAAVLDFLIPQGPMGPTGPQGPQGQTGAQGPQGIQGPIGLTGAQGPQGTQGPIGLTGAQGPQGTQGPIGLTGAQGSQGAQGPAGISNKGNWSSAAAYNPSDSVFASGSYWLATAANTNSQPSATNTVWQLVAAGINTRGAWDTAANYNANDAVSDRGSYWLALAANNSSQPSATNPNWQLLAAQGAPGAQGAQGIQGPKGDQGLQGFQGLQGPAGPAGPQGPTGPAGSGSGSSSSSLLSAFLPGSLTQAYTAASFVADSPITVTRISANLKTPPDFSCQPTVLRVSDGTSGQDVRILGGQAGKDTGAMSLKFDAGADLKVELQTPASCTSTNPPADANVIVQYRGQQSSDAETCAQSGLACNGICEETQSDTSNCGGCGNTCFTPTYGFAACSSGQCHSYCPPGGSICGTTCVGTQSDTDNCGACGNHCFVPGNGYAVCSAGQCYPQCISGYGLCGSTCLNISSDPNHCGGCGNVCSVPIGGFATCSSGQCNQQCIAGYTFCGQNFCANLQFDRTNCGACGHFCQSGVPYQCHPHACGPFNTDTCYDTCTTTGVCSSGTCQ